MNDQQPQPEKKPKKKTSSGTWGCLILIFIVIVIIWVIASSGTDTETAPSKSTPTTQTENASNSFKLASLEVGHNDPTQSLIDIFDSYLDSLEIKCPDEDETQIANYIFNTQEMINEKGGSMTLQEAAEGIDGSIPEDASGMISCAEVATAFVILVTDQ